MIDRKQKLAQCKVIEKITEDILQNLNRDDFKEPINWADLHCAFVEYVINADGDYYRVVVEEAAPNCNKLMGFVREKLKELGYKDIDVVTEW